MKAKTLKAGGAATTVLDNVRRSQTGTDDAADVQLALAAIGSAPEAPLDADDIEESFFLRLLKNNIGIDIAHSRTDAVQVISDFLYRERNTRRVVASHDAQLAALPWRDGGVLVRFGKVEGGKVEGGKVEGGRVEGGEVETGGKAGPGGKASPEDKVSISHAKLAIAESGTLVLFAGRDNPAYNNWLVEDHLIVVDAKSLVPSYEAAWPRLRALMEDGPPRGVNFISGPSGTADIALNPVVGAHGPRRVRVIYIGRPAPDALANARARCAVTAA